MTSPWLRDYVLEELGLEIRKQGEREQSAHSHSETTATAAAPRLVRIVARGQGGGGQRMGRDDWWTAVVSNSRNNKTIPNLENHTNAWLLVSDGLHSVELSLTVQSLRQIYDCSVKNYNNNDDFGRGCCVVLKKYCFEVHSDNVFDNNNDFLLDNGNIDHYTLRLKVSSLEPKPSFNGIIGIAHGTGGRENSRGCNNNIAGSTSIMAMNEDNVGSNGNNNSTIVRPVSEDIDIMYALQFLRRQRCNHQDQQQQQTGSTTSTTASTIARDWDIAFGRLSKGKFVATSCSIPIDSYDTRGNNDDIASNTALPRSVQQILELVEKDSRSEKAIHEWEMAKKEYGITVTSDDMIRGDDNGNNNNDNIGIGTAVTTNRLGRRQEINHGDGNDTAAEDFDDKENGGDDGEDDSGDEEDKYSRMFIQNVLATQQEDNEDGDEDASNEDEESLLLETQPLLTTTTTVVSTTTGGPKLVRE